MKCILRSQSKCSVIEGFKGTYTTLKNCRISAWKCKSEFFSGQTLIHNGAVCSFINDPHQNRGQQLSTRGFFYENCFSYMRSKYHYQERIFGSVEFLFWAILLALFYELAFVHGLFAREKGKIEKDIVCICMYIWILFLCFFVDRRRVGSRYNIVWFLCTQNCCY